MVLFEKYNIELGVKVDILYETKLGTRTTPNKGVWNKRKRVYKLTDKGKETTNVILNAKEEIIQSFTTTLL